MGKAGLALPLWADVEGGGLPLPQAASALSECPMVPRGGQPPCPASGLLQPWTGSLLPLEAPWGSHVSPSGRAAGDPLVTCVQPFGGWLVCSEGPRAGGARASTAGCGFNLSANISTDNKYCF